MSIQFPQPPPREADKPSWQARVFATIAEWLSNNPGVERYLTGLAGRLRGFAGTWTFGLSESLNGALGHADPDAADFQQGQVAGILSSIPFLARALERGIIGLAFQTSPDGVRILAAGSRALENAHIVGFIPFSGGFEVFAKPKPVVVPGFPTANVSRVVSDEMLSTLTTQAMSNQTGNNYYVHLLMNNFRKAPAANRYAFFSQSGDLKAVGYVFDRGSVLSPDMVAGAQYPMPIRDFIRALITRARSSGKTVEILPASPELATAYRNILSNQQFMKRLGYQYSTRPVLTDVPGVTEKMVLTPH